MFPPQGFVILQITLLHISLALLVSERMLIVSNTAQAKDQGCLHQKTKRRMLWAEIFLPVLVTLARLPIKAVIAVSNIIKAHLQCVLFEEGLGLVLAAAGCLRFMCLV